MSKKIIQGIVFLLCIFGSGSALENQSNIQVKNAIIPLNNNNAPLLNATITISNLTQTVSSGNTKVLDVQPNNTGAIIITAPLCGQYPGYECFVLLPTGCLNKVGKSGKLIISGLISDYGLDLRSLRCYYIPEEVQPIIIPPAKHHCLF